MYKLLITNQSSSAISLLIWIQCVGEKNSVHPDQLASSEACCQKLLYDVGHPLYVACKQQRHRSEQSIHAIVIRILESILTSYMSNFNYVATL